MSKAIVYRNFTAIGKIEYNLAKAEYSFSYDKNYLQESDSREISFTLPLQKEVFYSKTLFSFFSNLLAEGNIKKMQCRSLKIDEEDEFTRLIKTAHSNTIGSITIKEIIDEA